LAVGIAIRIYFDVSNQKKVLNSEMNSLSDKIERSFQDSISHAKDKYLLLSYHYMRHNKISNLMINRDNKELYKIIKHDYNKLISIENNLQSMHFIDKNNISLLRMHKDNVYGDDLSKTRPIVKRVNKTLETYFGFEVGKHLVSYRITIPYITYEKMHIGVLEYGLSPNYFVKELKKNFDIKSQILVSSSKLKKIKNKTQNEKIQDFTILEKDSIFEEINKNVDFSKKKQIINVKNRTYLVENNLNCKNYNDEIIAKIIVAKDITELIKESSDAIFFNNSINAALLVIILFFLYVIFSKYSVSIQKLYSDLNELNLHSEKLKHIADTDELTKIYNKRFFNTYLKDYLSHGKKGVIVFFDIDHFKSVNDNYGHIVGDEILVRLAQIIEKSIRSNDTFVRWGGEEFVILFENTDMNSNYYKCEELRKLVEKETFSLGISITISLGVTQIKEGDSIDDVLERADKLLYKAKANGRNRVERA